MQETINKKELLIFGVKNMALEMKEIALEYYSENFDKISTIFFSESFVGDNGLGDKVNRSDYTIYYIIGFGGTNREKCIESLSQYSNFVPFSIIHPSAVILKSAQVGKGCFIQPNATIATNAVIGDHCVINYDASVGHDTVLFDNVFIQPGARVSGNCVIGSGSMIGSNSFIYQNVIIGRECLVDALTYIHDDLPERMLASSRHEKPIGRDDLEQGKISMWQ